MPASDNDHGNDLTVKQNLLAKPTTATSPTSTESPTVISATSSPLPLGRRAPNPTFAFPGPREEQNGWSERQDQSHSGQSYHKQSHSDDGDDWIDGEEAGDPAMPSDLRPPFRRPSEGRSHTPLLKPGHKSENSYDSSTRPTTLRRKSTLHERDPEADAKAATRKRYSYAAFFLVLSLIAFTVQTETAVYIQHNLKWNKAYAMLYFTHGSWSSLWFIQLAILRISKWKMPWKTFWRRHVEILRQTALMVANHDIDAPARFQNKSPIPYILKMTAFITCTLTIAGGSWYVAVDLTTASDLTAIYNCSAFFAYVFSVPLLKEKLRLSKVLAVLVAIVGVLVVAYGGAKSAKHGSKSGGGAGGPDSDESSEANHRALGNIIIGIGSVLYGLYEVLYKKYACPPDGTSPGRSMIFANFMGSLIGLFTLLVLWIPIPILHFTGVERFTMPTGDAAWLLLISVFANAIFSGSFLVLVSLTSPVLSSVAALLTIFLVALVDQLLPPPLNSPLSAAAVVGGCLIIGAFLVLSWDTYREMQEERRQKSEIGVVDDESEIDEDDH